MTEKITREEIEALLRRTNDPVYTPSEFMSDAAKLSALCALALQAEAMQPRPELVLAYCDDWAGLYVNGKLKTQGHHVRADDVAEALGLAFSLREVPQEWAEELGEFPDALTALPEPRR